MGLARTGRDDLFSTLNPQVLGSSPRGRTINPKVVPTRDGPVFLSLLPDSSAPVAEFTEVDIGLPGSVGEFDFENDRDPAVLFPGWRFH